MMDDLELPETGDVEKVICSVSRDGKYVVLEQEGGYEVMIDRAYLPEVIEWFCNVKEGTTI